MSTYRVEKELDRNGAKVIAWVILAYVLAGVGIAAYFW